MKSRPVEFTTVIINVKSSVFSTNTYWVFWFLAAVMEGLFREMVSSNQSELSDEHCVSIVGPHSNLKNKDPVKSVL